MLLNKTYIILRSKILKIINLATNDSLNVKINEVKKEIPSTTNLATITAVANV